MSTHDIVTVGASAGGVEALMTLACGLPADLPAAVFVVLHVPAEGASLLPEILSRAGPLPAVHPHDGQQIVPGRIYVAPPDLHLVVERNRVRLLHGPRENRCRPSVDVLFRSAALAYGRRVVAVVLSGTLDDGTAGLAVVKARGGVAIVQNPATALFPGMPESAIEHVAVDAVLPAAEIPPLITELAHTPLTVAAAPPETAEMDEAAELLNLDPIAMSADMRPGQPSVYGCPECGGTLWEVEEGTLVRFRCRIGHTFSPDSLLAAQSDALEDALWAALRGLEEKVSLTRRLFERARDHARPHLAARFEEEMHLADRRAAVLRQLLLGGAGETVPDTPGEGEREDAEATG